MYSYKISPPHDQLLLEDRNHVSPYLWHLAQRCKVGTQQILKGGRLLVSSRSTHYTMQESLQLPPKMTCFYLDGSNDKDHCLTRQPISHPNILTALLHAAGRAISFFCPLDWTLDHSALALLPYITGPTATRTWPLSLCLPSFSLLPSLSQANLLPQVTGFPYPLFLAVVLLWTTSVCHVPS